ncbi:hypothetical protein BDN72DRAFT_500617 [Pluteus cervinus]|uniref:Uncharacterized protein n=1 Tax=Pluteus cervinus TaxID=181527 RepID=A0ACD3AZE6_9AGAR|nr:hypothetical protein BDN72DRAFT_500617 [Pluteus cervinus]
MDALAPELLENILHHVASSNPSELAVLLGNCSLVSHKWKEIAQPLLFSKLLLYGLLYDQVRLHQTLISYPHLHNLVRCIWINLDILPGRSELDLDKDALVDLYHQLTSNPRFHHIVIKENAESVDLQSYKTLCGLVTSSHLTTLSVYELRQFPIGIFYQCTSVRELHIYWSNFSAFESEGDGRLSQDKRPEFRSSSNRSTMRPHLLHLYLESAFEDDVALIKWFLHPDCAFDISGLKTFHFLDMSDQLESFTLARSLVQRASSTLESLALDPPTRFTREDYYMLPDYNKFDPLPQLRYLKLSLQEDNFPHASLWPWITQFLSSLSHPGRLEELHLACILTDYTTEVMDKDHGWEELDLLLASSMPFTVHRKFSNLTGVTFGVVNVAAQNREDERRTGRALPSLLPRLQELGILRVTFSNVLGFVEDADCWYHSREEE